MAFFYAVQSENRNEMVRFLLGNSSRFGGLKIEESSKLVKNEWNDPKEKPHLLIPYYRYALELFQSKDGSYSTVQKDKYLNNSILSSQLSSNMLNNKELGKGFLKECILDPSTSFVSYQTKMIYLGDYYHNDYHILEFYFQSFMNFYYKTNSPNKNPFPVYRILDHAFSTLNINLFKAVKYNEIKSVEWMLDNNYQNLFIEKFEKQFNLIQASIKTQKSLLLICKKLNETQFNMVYNRMLEQKQEKLFRKIDLVLGVFSNKELSIEICKKMYQELISGSPNPSFLDSINDRLMAQSISSGRPKEFIEWVLEEILVPKWVENSTTTDTITQKHIKFFTTAIELELYEIAEIFYQKINEKTLEIEIMMNNISEIVNRSIEIQNLGYPKELGFNFKDLELAITLGHLEISILISESLTQRNHDKIDEVFDQLKLSTIRKLYEKSRYKMIEWGLFIPSFKRKIKGMVSAVFDQVIIKKRDYKILEVLCEFGGEGILDPINYTQTYCKCFIKERMEIIDIIQRNHSHVLSKNIETCHSSLFLSYARDYSIINKILVFQIEPLYQFINWKYDFDTISAVYLNNNIVTNQFLN
eukprot:gene5750-7153_t